MRIAVVGSGISGLVAAHLLSQRHQVTLFEAADRLGGHTNTVDVRDAGGREFAVDTGFIVFNERNYPNFTRLLDELRVATQPTSMSFSVRCDRTRLEYSSESLFAQRRNFVRPSYWRMLLDVVRFHRLAPAALGHDDDGLVLGRFLEEGRFSRSFIDRHIIPMGAAIWSTDPVSMMRFPAAYFIRFFQNHGLLSLYGQPRWRVIRGGSRSYLGPLTRPFRDGIRTSSRVERISRKQWAVEIVAAGAAPEAFDHVVLACHSDQALAMLADPSAPEREVLGALRYQRNEAVLHTDTGLLPRRRAARAAWNYHVTERPGPVSVTYDMNRLQGLVADHTFSGTPHRSEDIRPERVLRRFVYEHPVYTPEAVAAQRRHGEISGRQRTSFCGAYWGYGFHEDGVDSALRVAAAFDIVPAWQSQPTTSTTTPRLRPVAA